MKKALPTGGFTLVELLVVIAIIAILAAIGLTIFSGAQKNARDARRKADINAISKALEAHNGDTTCGATVGTYCVPENGWFTNGTIPKDPTTLVNYAGVAAITDGINNYNICATMEVGGSTFCRTQQM